MKFNGKLVMFFLGVVIGATLLIFNYTLLKNFEINLMRIYVGGFKLQHFLIPFIALPISTYLMVNKRDSGYFLLGFSLIVLIDDLPDLVKVIVGR